MARITAELTKGDRYSAFIDLPANKRQLQDAKWRARFNGADDESVTFSLGSGFPDLEFPEMTGDRLEEINYLAHRIDSMSDDELTAYKALLTTIEGTMPDMKTMINMTYGLDRIEVSPAANVRELGEHYIDNDLLSELEGVPDAAIPFIDRDAVGKLVAERNEGMFIDGMYVEIGNYVMPEEYDGEHIPDAEAGDIRVSLANKDTGMTDSFQLPVDSDTLDRISEKYDFEGIIDVTDQSGNIRAGMIKSAADIEALNKLAENLNAMTDEEHIVFSAAMQSEEPATIEAMLDLSEHTAEYELDRDATYYDDFGREYIEAFLPEDFDTNLLDRLGTHKFGEMVAAKIGASITDYGMISERGRQLGEMVYKEDKMPVIFDDGEETEAPDQTEDETENAEEVTTQDEDVEEQPSDEEQNDDPEQALTDEHFEVIEIFGQEALFTEGKIHDNEIPEGMYRYDFRSGDGVDFAALERKVDVDRSGSILTREPIDFGDRDHIELDEESSPNFTGREMTVEEFAAIAVISAQDTHAPDDQTEDVSEDIDEAAPENAADDPAPEEDHNEVFGDPDEEISDFVPFPDDYPEAYITLDEADGGDYLFDAPPEDFDGDDPAFVDCDEDEGMGMMMF